MRVVVLATAAALLASCEHMYGGVDRGLSDASVIQMARHEAARRSISLRGLEPSVSRFDTGISISFHTPDCREQACIDGGLPHFFIPAGAQNITYVRTAY